MLTPENVFLAVQPVDMRRGIDTLTQYVQDELKSSWHEGAAFVFTNNRIRPVTTWLPAKSKSAIHCLNTAVSTSAPDEISRVNTSTPDPIPAFPPNLVPQESGMSCPQHYTTGTASGRLSFFLLVNSIWSSWVKESVSGNGHLMPDAINRWKSVRTVEWLRLRCWAIARIERLSSNRSRSASGK